MIQRFKKAPQLFCSFAVAFIARLLVQRIKEKSGLYSVQLIPPEIKIAAVIDEIIGIFFYIFEVCFFPRFFPKANQAAQKYALMVVPAPGRWQALSVYTLSLLFWPLLQQCKEAIL